MKKLFLLIATTLLALCSGASAGPTISAEYVGNWAMIPGGEMLYVTAAGYAEEDTNCDFLKVTREQASNIYDITARCSSEEGNVSSWIAHKKWAIVEEGGIFPSTYLQTVEKYKGKVSAISLYRKKPNEQ
jgi:hypothetical protein